MSNQILTGQSLYYKHSGKFDPSKLAIVLALSPVVVIVVGSIYAYLDLYSPVDKLSIIFTIGAAFANAGFLAYALKKANTRNTPLALLVTLAVSVLLLVWIWDVWLYAFIRRGGEDVSIFDIVTQPGATWECIKSINETGAWKLNNRAVTGIELAGIWCLEAAIFLVTALALVFFAINKLPFCEHCRKWGEQRPLIALNAGDPNTLRSALERKDFSIITTLGKYPDSLGTAFQLSLEGCPSCDTTQTLCVNSVTKSVNKKGQESTKTRRLIRRLRLTPEETVAVATAVAALQVPTTEPQA